MVKGPPCLERGAALVLAFLHSAVGLINPFSQRKLKTKILIKLSNSNTATEIIVFSPPLMVKHVNSYDKNYGLV